MRLASCSRNPLRSRRANRLNQAHKRRPSQVGCALGDRVDRVVQYGRTARFAAQRIRRGLTPLGHRLAICKWWSTHSNCGTSPRRCTSRPLGSRRRSLANASNAAAPTSSRLLALSRSLPKVALSMGPPRLRRKGKALLRFRGHPHVASMGPVHKAPDSGIPATIARRTHFRQPASTHPDMAAAGNGVESWTFSHQSPHGARSPSPRLNVHAESRRVQVLLRCCQPHARAVSASLLRRLHVPWHSQEAHVQQRHHVVPMDDVAMVGIRHLTIAVKRNPPENAPREPIRVKWKTPWGASRRAVI